MELAASRYGYGVDPTQIEGAVVSVFAHACEILGWNERLTTLVTRGGCVPGGIVVEAPPEFRFDRTVSVAAKASARGGVLRFAQSDLSIDLRDAYAWRCGIRDLALDPLRPASRSVWESARLLLVEDGRALPLISLAAASLAALANPARAIGAAESLIGLGDGVTPAGDDALVGFLAGLWARGDAFAAKLGHAVIGFSPRTHRVSRAYLEAAAVGEFSELLSNLASALKEGDDERTRRAARVAIAVGHSSGACGVLGLLLGTASGDVSRLVGHAMT
jgi:hypothetical protein